MGKTLKAEPDLKLWTLRPREPHHMGGKIHKNKSGYTLAELRPRPRKGSKKHFLLKIPDLVQRPTATTDGDKNRN